MRRIVLFAILVTAAASQSTPPLPEFEVASVKPTPPPDPAARSESLTFKLANGRATGQNATLKMMLIKAYGVKDYQILGPDWLSTERYDMLAKAPADTPDSQLPLMLQRLLAERFGIKLHRDSKEMRVFDLVITPKGLTVARAEKETGVSISGQIAGKTTLSSLANILTIVLKTPVVDRTDTPGIFDFKINWESDDPIPSGALLSEVLQRQTGLRLEARKGPVEILVIDHADKTPTEN